MSLLKPLLIKDLIQNISDFFSKVHKTPTIEKMVKCCNLSTNFLHHHTFFKVSPEYTLTESIAQNPCDMSVGTCHIQPPI